MSFPSTPVARDIRQTPDVRFAFGENWSHFLRFLSPERIADAERSLTALIGEDQNGRMFLDAGCGSGLFSLAARRLGAQVHSFDYDEQSVACTRLLKNRYFAGDEKWAIERGSVLDAAYMAKLGQFDTVYSWGVLHHTGSMWQAIENIASTVKPGGRLIIAIYNDQGWLSRYWLQVKKAYHKGSFFRAAVITMHAPYLMGVRWLAQSLKGTKREHRGMTLRYDMLDWLGGYPFEVATPEAIERFCEARGLKLDGATTCGRRHGCNEFAFRRANA